MDEKTAVCGTCGVMGLPREMHRASLPVAGSLPTLPNQVTWRCRDEAACVARIAYKHRNDALKSSDDPLYAAGNVIDRLREDLTRIADDLSAVQDGIGRARVHYLQEPADSAVERAAKALSKALFNHTRYAEDPLYFEAARAAVKAALYDAEEPIAPDAPDPASPVPSAVLDAMAEAMERADGGDRQEASYFGLAKAAAAAIPADLWAEQVECLETRTDRRGDCAGRMVKAELIKPNEFGLPIGQSGGLVSLCRSHWQQSYRCGEVGMKA